MSKTTTGEEPGSGVAVAVDPGAGLFLRAAFAKLSSMSVPRSATGGRGSVIRVPQHENASAYQAGNDHEGCYGNPLCPTALSVGFCRTPRVGPGTKVLSRTVVVIAIGPPGGRAPAIAVLTSSTNSRSAGGLFRGSFSIALLTMPWSWESRPTKSGTSCTTLKRIASRTALAERRSSGRRIGHRGSPREHIDRRRSRGITESLFRRHPPG